MKGILVYECDSGGDEFLGTGGFVNGRPFIALNSSITRERSREAMAYELVRLMFAWPESMNDKEVEQAIATIAACFQSPASATKREFGTRKSATTKAPIEREGPVLFERLTQRAVNEGEISVQRGAELLKIPLSTVLAMLRPNETQSPNKQRQ